jgi:hypothetical protein
MLKKPYRIGALLATLAAVGTMAVAAAPAGAEFTKCTAAEEKAEICIQLTAPFIQYHVSGKFVTKGGAGQTINLNGAPGAFTGGPFPPKRDGFTGFAIVALRSPFLTPDFASGSINSTCPKEPIFKFNFPKPCGNLSPPFTGEVEFPDKSGEHQVATFTTEESPRETGCLSEFPLCSTPSGEFHTTAGSNCPSPALGSPIECIHEEIGQSLRLGYAVHGPGKGLASQTESLCETSEPVKFTLADNLTFPEFAFLGSHFVGSFNTPSITCGGRYANGRGSQMTESFSGPTNYDICVQPVVPDPFGVTKLDSCPEFITGEESGV